MKELNPDVVILVEPKISGTTADRVCRRLGFDEFQREEAVGFSGGIWVLWHSTQVTLNRISSSKQFVHFEGENGSIGKFFLTAVYGSPSVAERESLWSSVCALAVSVHILWLLSEDFNAMLSLNDKQGGARFSFSQNQSFIDCSNSCQLSDTPVIGPKFTWSRGTTLERIDRTISNEEWRVKFPFTRTRHLRRIYSDHRPIFTTCEDPSKVRLPRPFRFMAAWLGHENFRPTLCSTWHNNLEIPDQLQRLPA
ncbi:hypothetical protein LINPERHAP2_LOCUS37442 [Linum perenne]